MLKSFVVSACMYIASVNGEMESLHAPGRAILWSPRPSDAHSSFPLIPHSSPTYKTQTTSVDDITSFINDAASTKELLVMFCSDKDATNEFYQLPAFSASIQQSGDATILPNVYHTVDANKQSICQQVAGNGGIQSVTASEMVSLMYNSKEILNNGILDSYLVSIPTESSPTLNPFKELFELTPEGNTLFVALQNPTGTAPNSAGDYHRLLTSDISEGNDYLPEGTEFSIYSQNTYLYLTPDIFTGLMTGLFMFFVLMIGFNCLGAIQGPATFAKTLPALGKEG